MTDNIIPFPEPDAPAQTFMDALDDLIAERSGDMTIVTIIGILFTVAHRLPGEALEP